MFETGNHSFYFQSVLWQQQLLLEFIPMLNNFSFYRHQQCADVNAWGCQLYKFIFRQCSNMYCLTFSRLFAVISIFRVCG